MRAPVQSLDIEPGHFTLEDEDEDSLIQVTTPPKDLRTRSPFAALHRLRQTLAGVLIVLTTVLLLGLSVLGWALVLTQNFSTGSTTASDKQSVQTDFHILYTEMLSSARYIDLTHTISSATPVWSGFGPSSTRAGVAGKSIPGWVADGEEYSYLNFGFVTTAYDLTTDQLGTQLDPPAHWNELGATISDLPPTVSLRPLVVIDVSSKVYVDPGYHATVEDVTDWEARHGLVPSGSVVFFRTDWSKNWSVYKDEGLPEKYPGVKLDTLKHLHLERQILMHGHEPLDTDATPTLEGEAWLMHHNFMQAEGVTNLHLVAETGCLVSIGFARLQGGSGGYARYIAICPPQAGSGGMSITDAPGAPLPTQSSPLRRSGSTGVLEPTPGAIPTNYCSVKGALGCADGKPTW
ncbi:hypothetical protein CYMTET_7456 [Cymbomonas tetramitiformis]|uniref:Cyclase n=1 Tax=Cymbomonas tetramitiformis TaxID=36881 RepID=A0AAE0LHG4_9CHLO|nr:hypothetical protein CYMTET_7456 [Cymbomonas tetramitiformis]